MWSQGNHSRYCNGVFNRYNNIFQSFPYNYQLELIQENLNVLQREAAEKGIDINSQEIEEWEDADDDGDDEA